MARTKLATSKSKERVPNLGVNFRLLCIVTEVDKF